MGGIKSFEGGKLKMNFDDYAKSWDTEKRIERANRISEEIRKAIDISGNYNAMEFGCGTGLISFNLYDKFKTISLVDSSKGMIDILNSKIDKYKVNNIIPLHMDIANNEQINKKFDVIYNSMVLHHIHDTDLIIRKFYDMLNNDGYLCIVDLDKEDGRFHLNYPEFDGHNGFDQEKLKHILAKAGFKDIRSYTFYDDVKTIGDERIEYSLFLLKARKY